MVQPHLIVLDLDGTLLQDNQRISLKTKQTIQLARQQGHQVMIATGRPFRASKVYYDELALDTPIVNFNGAYIHHPLKSQFNALHSPIDLHTVTEIVDALQSFKLSNIIAEVMDDIYVEKYDQQLLSILGMGNPKITTGSMIKMLKDHPTSMLIHSDEMDVPPIRQFLADTKAELIDHRRWGAPYHVIELVRNGIHKAIGLDYVAKSLQIPRERIIAFDDEDNDLEMIEYAGIGVAMGNAIDDLKKSTLHVTATNNEDGIAHFLLDRLSL
ncbi:Cof-type HAD-IIB family hydrolase [Kurthia sibirica]|uniref:Cof-type HAD-IIB family hydrolase n=1 Tax=Kurthia sibirica TaxID=202750 RepID=A0A2U3AMU4_9BACL|nr:Cof-type HAD-IIB family hydrolase [Kurthia sibirica]PWI25836.1 Cof-type HAD-IIB family hydrolase [Kurthia sibirica]GEK33655.1 haloacid dehalogenase [Kurthia sibirica]